MIWACFNLLSVLNEGCSQQTLGHCTGQHSWEQRWNVADSAARLQAIVLHSLEYYQVVAQVIGINHVCNGPRLWEHATLL